MSTAGGIRALRGQVRRACGHGSLLLRGGLLRPLLRGLPRSWAEVGVGSGRFAAALGADAARAIQRLLETVTVPLQGEHFLRRPSRLVQAGGFQIERRERFKLGVVERVAAQTRVTLQSGTAQLATRP